MIPFLLSWIVFLKWLISFLARKRRTRLVWQHFFQEIYRLHGLPMSIFSDLDTRFLGHFWRSLFKLLRKNLDMSSAYLPQIDGQTGVTNRTLGNLLCCLVANNLKSRDTKLCQAEFAHNYAKNQSLGFSPFRVVSAGPLDLSYLPDRTQFHRQAIDFVDGLHLLHKQLKENLEVASEKY